MPTMRFFAQARDAAGVSSAVLPGETVGAALDAAVDAYGSGFAEVLAASKVWRNGEPTDRDEPTADGDEIAVLPPVSGG